MPYIGKSPVGGGFHKLDNLTASATATYALTLSGAAYYPETANQLLVSLNGVIQAPQDSFTVSGSNLIFDTALTASDSIDFVVALGDVLGVGSVTDGAITTAKIANQAVTMDKLATSGTLPALDGSALTGLSGSNVLETFTLVCNGEPITVGSGTYTPTNVTAVQTLTDAHTVITGSSIAYTPPSGATDVIYEFSWHIDNSTTATELAHYAMRIDGTQITGTRHTWSSAGTYDNKSTHFQWRIPIGGTASTTTGRVASWTSAKTIDMTMRNYVTSNYQSVLHRSVYWDGTSLALVPQPILKITALG